MEERNLHVGPFADFAKANFEMRQEAAPTPSTSFRTGSSRCSQGVPKIFRKQMFRSPEHAHPSGLQAQHKNQKPR
jgi:hypothetical protein